MKQDEQERLETTLRQISPAAPSENLMARLHAAMAEASAGKPRQETVFRVTKWFSGWYRLTLAAPAAAIILLWLAFRPATLPSPAVSPKSPDAKANAVQVGHSLVASFDTVAELPGAAPVRFRCREWEDNVVVHGANGVVISKTTPRVEIVPVRFETY